MKGSEGNKGGKVKGIAGQTVTIDTKGLRLYEKVLVGDSQLLSEVVRIDEDKAVAQVYEDTRGLAIGEDVISTGKPLSIKLGAGLLKGIFDGLQRPLIRLRDETGDFIVHLKKAVDAIDYKKSFGFIPLKEIGDEVSGGETIGYIEEGDFKHYIKSRSSGRLSWIAQGMTSLNMPVARLEHGEEIGCIEDWDVRIQRPFKRKLTEVEPLITGQRCIDLLFTIPKGGVAILPGGFGTGKTVLQQSIAKFADVDVVVYVGCGERGNEMAELIEDFERLNDPWTGRRLMERTILVINTSNMPVAAREASIYTAVTMAEYYRDMGYHVLLLADSISRWAEALREISSSLQEMPGEEGYPTYLASRLSGFFERAGVVETLDGRIGSLTMLISVSPPGGDFTEPVTQACLRGAGTFLMLDTSLAHRRHFPAINWSQSYSLFVDRLSGYFKEKVSDEWAGMRGGCIGILNKEGSLREIAEIVGFEGLQEMDKLHMYVAERIRLDFLSQNAYTDDAFSPPDKTFSSIKTIMDFYNKAKERLKGGATFNELVRV
ncbi:MAG: ATP synthase subunit A [Thermodesulfovibrionia bacterium]